MQVFLKHHCIRNLLNISMRHLLLVPTLPSLWSTSYRCNLTLPQFFAQFTIQKSRGINCSWGECLTNVTWEDMVKLFLLSPFSPWGTVLTHMASWGTLSRTEYQSHLEVTNLVPALSPPQLQSLVPHFCPLRCTF